MDLNPSPPADWQLETGPYELAEYCQAQSTDVLVLLNAWLEYDYDLDDGPDEPSWRTLQYWATRLRPLWHYQHKTDNDFEPLAHHETMVVICNRTGEENGGTSHPNRSIDDLNQYVCRHRFCRFISFIPIKSGSGKA